MSSEGPGDHLTMSIGEVVAELRNLNPFGAYDIPSQPDIVKRHSWEFALRETLRRYRERGPA